MVAHRRLLLGMTNVGLSGLSEKLAPRFVPGSLARSNLYYSWATLTLLGRAVHCNVRRPALWVFPPLAQDASCT